MDGRPGGIRRGSPKSHAVGDGVQARLQELEQVFAGLSLCGAQLRQRSCGTGLRGRHRRDDLLLGAQMHAIVGQAAPDFWPC